MPAITGRAARVLNRGFDDLQVLVVVEVGDSPVVPTGTNPFFTPPLIWSSMSFFRSA